MTGEAISDPTTTLFLNKQQILALDRALKAELEQSSLFTGCRDNAFVQMAAFVEEVDQSLKYPIFELDNYEASNSVTTSDILAFAVWFAWKHCTACRCRAEHVPDQTIRSQILATLSGIAKYAYVFDHLLMCLAGHATVMRNEFADVVFQTQKSNKQIQVLDYHSRPLEWSEPIPIKILSGIARICEQRLTCVATKRIYYKRNFEIVRAIMDFLRPLYEQLHFFGEIGIPSTYKLSEFREVWLCLVSIVFFHGRMTKVFQASHPIQLITSADLCFEKKYWVNLLSRLTRVRSDHILSILNDLSYNGDKYTRPDKAPLPPLLPVGTKLLLLNRVLVTSLGEQDLY